MSKQENSPDWWPKNPYGTNKDWLRKSVEEQVWEITSEDCYKAMMDRLEEFIKNGK